MEKQIKIDPVKVFIASTPAEWLPMKVLEFSIKEKTDSPVQISAIYRFNRAIPRPRAIDNRPRTPFSFQRFLIPELCGFSGKAIYLDADMLVFRDISKLWNQPFLGCDLQTVMKGDSKRYEQFSVLLLDCERLRWDIEEIVNKLDSGMLDYAGLMYKMEVASKIGRDIPSEWNSLESYNPKATALVHYTDMNTQPWISLFNPLDYLWISCLRRAIAKGFISEKEIEREVSDKHIRPSLQAQLATDIDNGIKLPRNIKVMDKRYKAPYHYLKVRSKRPWQSASKWLLASFRKAVYKYAKS